MAIVWQWWAVAVIGGGWWRSCWQRGIVVTVDIGDDGGVGAWSSSGHGYGYGEKWGGLDHRGVVEMEQRGMGNGQL